MSERVVRNESPTSLEEARRALEAMASRLAAAEGRWDEPIAIVGMGCRFPGGASTPEKYWKNLQTRVDAVTEVPRDRFDIDQYYDPRPGTPGKTNTRHGAFVDGIQDMDTTFFGIAPKNAAAVDPQQRLAGKACWDALEDAGIAASSLEGSLTGVFLGIWGVDYWHRLASRPVEELDANVIGGNTHSVAAGGISYALGLRGPSLVVDTACSSSLVAVDLACQSLRSGASDLALAGGVNVVLGPENYICLSATEVLAADGRCKAFDAAADGFVRGEGAGIVVLKRLSDAVRDEDRILAVIRGACVNQDGKTSGITVPNQESQEEAVRRALRQAGISPADVQYVEAHGTGTSVGDPIEVAALGSAYGPGRPESEPLLLGSVKSNIGHLETAAGIAGLMKVVLSLQHEELPPNLHFKTPNPRIPWADLPVRVVAENTPWRRGARPRYAGVSSFGASGTNVHVVVGEAPLAPRPERLHPERPRHLLTLSARTKDAFRAAASRLAAHLSQNPELDAADVCHTLNAGRSTFKLRLALTGASTEELIAKLTEAAASETPGSRVRGSAKPVLAFVFTGQGSQYPQMGRGLYATQPAFRAALDRCDAILRPLLGGRLLDVVHPAPGAATPLDETTWTQPALFAVEYALAQMWLSWGVAPSVVMGHSVGEYVAACVAGVFSLEDGLKLIAARARLMGALPREGQMVAILTDEARVAAAVAPHAGDVAIATLNGPENVVISGRSEPVEAIAKAFEAQGVETKRLKVSHAFHSPLMEPMLADFEKAAREVAYAPPRMPLVSNVSGALAGPEVATPGYWVRHVRDAVRFADGVRALHAWGANVFLEVGAKPVLSGTGPTCLPEGAGSWLPSLRPGQDDWEQVLDTLGALWVRGIAMDWKAFDAGYGRQRLPLPSYPFQEQRHWIEAAPARPAANGSWLAGLLEARKNGRIDEEVRRTGSVSADEARILGRLLDLFAEEYERHAAPKSVVAEYYNAIPTAARQLEAGSAEEQAERYLTFGPFHEILPDFSWVTVFADPVRHREEALLAFEAQKEMREALFRKVDFAACRSVLDFGCGYSSDLVALAQKHPHLNLTGYTIAGEQARIGNKKVEALGLEGRVQVLNRDSARDEFPGHHDLVFGFEVAHHVPDKPALFGNIGRHLNEGGKLVLADFISRAGFSIDHSATSSFFITKDEWIELLSTNHLMVVECVDISQEIANFLHDPNFDATLAKVDPFRTDANIVAGFKSYDQLGKLLRQKLTDYVLLTASKRTDVPREELKRHNDEALSAPTPYSETSLAGGSYEVQWTPKAGAAQTGPNGHPRRWVLLADSQGTGAALARRLEKAGDRCVTITAGAAFAQEGPGRYVVDPASREDVRRALKEIQAAGEPLRGVVHLWSLDAEPAAHLTPAGLERAQVLGCETVLHLVQGLAEMVGAEKPRLWLVTRGAQAVGDAPVEVAQAPLVGLGKTILLEHPELWGGMVDLDTDDPSVAAGSLAAELAVREAEYHVAYRGGVRNVARLARRARPAPAKPPVRADASYLVAGGLGALGLRIAGWLVDEGARHLVLTSRRAPSEAAREAIRALEARGARVLVVEADVARAEDVKAILDKVSVLPPLKGVVNAAGVLDDGVLAEQTRERFRKVMAPKVQGSYNLHAATRDLDFFVCFSSAASLFGSAGQGNYAAANAFMDALAHRRRAEGLPGLSVNWGAWAETGMAANLTAAQRRQLGEAGVGEVEPTQGLRFLGDLIVEGRPQAGVSPMNWLKFFRGTSGDRVMPYFVRVAPTAAAIAAAAAVAVAAEPTDFLTSLGKAPSEQHGDLIGRYLQERVAKILGYKDPGQVDRDLTLLEMGFDSLMAVQLRNSLRTSLGTDVPIGKLFDSTSVDGLVDVVRERLNVATAASGEHVEVI